MTSPPEPAATRRQILQNALVFASALTANQQEAEASGRGYHISRKLKAKEAVTRICSTLGSFLAVLPFSKFETAEAVLVCFCA